MPDDSLTARIRAMMDSGPRWEGGPLPSSPQVQILNPQAQVLATEENRRQGTLLQGLSPSEDDQRRYAESEAGAQQQTININRILGNALAPSPEGISRTLLNIPKAIWHPYEAGAGVLGGFGKVLQSLGKNVNSGLQAVSPIDLNAVSKTLGLGDQSFPEYVTMPHTLNGEAWKDYAYKEGSQLSHAIPILGDTTDAIVKNYQLVLKQDPLYLPKDVWSEPKAAALVGAIAMTAGDIVLPPLRTLVSGEVPDGKGGTRPAGVRDTMGALTDIFLMAAPLRGLAGKTGLPSALELIEGKQVGPASMKLARSLGEIESTDTAKAAQASEQGTFLANLMNRKPNSEEARAGTPPLTGSVPVGHPKTSEFPVTDQGQAAASIAGFNEVLRKQFNISQAFEAPLMQGLMDTVLKDTLLTRKVMQNVLNGDRINVALVRTLGDDSFTPYISRIARDSGVEPEVLQQAVAASFENTSHTAGVGLNMLSQTLSDLEDHFFVKADRGSLTERLEAQKQLTLLRNLRQQASSDPTSQLAGTMASLTKKAQKFERVRINFMLSNLSTAINIARDQGLTSVTDMFDAMNTGVMNSVQGAARKGPGSVLNDFGANFADSIGQIHTLYEMLPSPLRALTAPAGSRWAKFFGGFDDVEGVLDAMPFLKKSLNSGLLPDAQMATASFLAKNLRQATKEAAQAAGQAPGGIGTRLKAGLSSLQESVPKVLETEQFLDPFDLPKTTYNTAMLAADVLTIPLKAQEKFFRKYTFRARLESNLAPLGRSIEDIIPDLTTPKFKEVLDPQGRQVIDTRTGQPKIGDIVPLDPALRGALVNAYDHAMRQTWAATPQGGALGGMLNLATRINAVSPLQTSMVLTPFLRATANAIMWQAHHNPTGLTDLLMPEYQEAWKAPGTGRLSLAQSRDVQRRMGESLTGLQLLGASLYMADGRALGPMQMGPKPWIWTTGPEDPQTHERPTRDLRSDPIFAAYMTTAHVMKSVLEGRPPNVTFQEAFEIYSNNRVAQTPLFNFADEIRNLSSANSQTAWEAVMKFPGKYLGPFGTLAHSLREEWGPLLKQAAQPANAVLPLHTPVGTLAPIPAPEALVRPSIQHSPLEGPFLKGASPSSLPAQYDPFTGKLDTEPRPVHALVAGPSQTMNPVEYLMVKSGLSTLGITRSYARPEAQQLVNQATGTTLNDPSFQIGGLQVQDYAKRLIALDDPTFAKIFFDKILLPVLHERSELTAMAKDLKDSNPRGTIPPHFIDAIAKKYNLTGDPVLEKAIESQLQLRLLRELTSAKQRPAGAPTQSAPTTRP